MSASGAVVAVAAGALPAAVGPVGLAGCASSPVTLRESYVAPPAKPNAASATNRPERKRVAVAAAAPKNDCAVQVVTLGDSRGDPEFLGVVGGRAVHSPGQGAEWIG